MNYVMWKSTGIDRMRILGSAGMLDSARFRTVLSDRYGVPSLDVEAYAVGEHGDNQVPVFSRVTIKRKKKTFSETERIEIMNGLKEAALQVISKKGATIYAPASNTANIVEAIIRDEKKIAICSLVLNGEYRLKDVSLGVPVVLGRNGAEKILEWNLDEHEKTLFYKRADQLKDTLKAMFIS
jgi:malate dehydrogenase